MPGVERIFSDPKIFKLIQNKLPMLFQIANLESSRDKKIGMEVGTLRERIIIAFLIHVFGRKNVLVDTPITAPEIDVKLFNNPISIKTVTGAGGVKLIWTVDATKANEFLSKYRPSCDIMLTQIFWGKRMGGLFYIPLSAQDQTFRRMGASDYLMLPKQGTNPRGVELSKGALSALLTHPGTMRVEIDWKEVKELDYDVYERWLEYWKE